MTLVPSGANARRLLNGPDKGDGRGGSLTSTRQIVVRGLTAGLIGATVLALWFLIIDSIQGQPFHTPEFLASVLAGVDSPDRSFLMIAIYTVFHYSAFAFVGISMAWLVSKLDATPPILLGLVLGFVQFDLVFYLGVVLTGVDVVRELGWPEVLSGNLLAGIALMAFLYLAMGKRGSAWLLALTRHRIVREGLVAGVLGASAVALWFFLFDMLRGEAFFTPGALGSALFLRVANVTAVEVSLQTVGGYTLVHFAAFILVGIGAAAIAVQAEKFPPLILAGLLIFATFEAFFLGLLAVAAAWLLGALGWVSIGLGNLLATAIMAFYLLRCHPELRAALGRQTLDDDDAEFSLPEARR
jgi:hypothetical protein